MKKYNFWNDPFGWKRKEEAELDALIAKMDRLSKKVDEALAANDFQKLDTIMREFEGRIDMKYKRK